MKRLSIIGFVALFLLAGCARANLPVPATPSAADPTVAVPADANAVAVGTATLASCTGVLTSANMEGPYYKAGAPERANLIDAGMPGQPIRISGRVFDQACNLLPGAKVDFWQADANGVYDNTGYILRGYVVTDADGAYTLDTIEPGVYPGRPPHVHVKVFAPDGRELLTTQMYFAGSENSGDVLGAPDLLVPYLGLDDQGRQQIAFDFVVQE
jgi:protocatechuate 3,4-dioxygenase beta subunit